MLNEYDYKTILKKIISHRLYVNHRILCTDRDIEIDDIGYNVISGSAKVTEWTGCTRYTYHIIFDAYADTETLDIIKRF